MDYYNTVITDGPLSYLTLDETTGIPYDGGWMGISTWSATATTFIRPSLTSTGYNAYQFASGDAITTYDQFANWGGQYQYTIEGWWRPDPFHPYDMYMWQMGSYDNATLYIDTGRNANFSSNYEYGNLGNVSDIFDGNPHHIVIVYDLSVDNQVHLYIDGALRGSASVSNPGYETYSGTFWQGVGDIDEVAVFDYALNSGQVAAHYAAGAPAGGSTTNQSINATASSSVAFTKRPGKLITATAGKTVTAVKRANKSLTTTVGKTVTQIKGLTKSFTVTAGKSITLVPSRAFLRTMTAVSTSAITLRKGVSKGLNAVSTKAVTSSKRVGKLVTATKASTITVRKGMVKSLTANSASSATIGQSLIVIIQKALTATATSVVTIRKNISRTLTRTINSIITATKRPSKSFSTSSSATASLIAGKAYLRVMTATVGSVASIIKGSAVAKVLTTTVSSTSNFVKRIGINRLINSNTNTTVTKRITKSITRIIGSTASISRIHERILSASNAVQVRVAKHISKPIFAEQGFIVTFNKHIPRVLSVFSMAEATQEETRLGRVWEQTLNAVSNAIPATVRNIFRYQGIKSTFTLLLKSIPILKSLGSATVETVDNNIIIIATPQGVKISSEAKSVSVVPDGDNLVRIRPNGEDYIVIVPVNTGYQLLTETTSENVQALR